MLSSLTGMLREVTETKENNCMLKINSKYKTLKYRLFDHIEQSQNLAMKINDLSTAIKLNWLKYSLDSIDYDNVVETYQNVMILGKLKGE
jgi:hypothetical protein